MPALTRVFRCTRAVMRSEQVQWAAKELRILGGEKGSMNLVPLGNHRLLHVERGEAGDTRTAKAFSDHHVVPATPSRLIADEGSEPQGVNPAKPFHLDSINRFGLGGARVCRGKEGDLMAG